MHTEASSPETKNIQPTTEDGRQVKSSSQERFYASEQCLMARKALQDMVDNPKYNTDSDYFSGYALGFVDRHLYYLSAHPTMKLEGYLSNLKLMTSMKHRA